MKRVTFITGIGFVGAEHRDSVDYDDDEFDELTEEELYQLADEFGQQYLETWYEVSEV